MSREIERMVTENNTLEAQNNRSKGAYDCYVCMEKTSDSRKQAALIPCGHTVCEDCAETMQGRPCPICLANCTKIVVLEDIRYESSYDCCICMEKYSNLKKPAALIPCGHTVCEECAPQVQGQPCPECFPSLSSLINTD